MGGLGRLIPVLLIVAAMAATLLGMGEAAPSAPAGAPAGAPATTQVPLEHAAHRHEHPEQINGAAQTAPSMHASDEPGGPEPLSSAELRRYVGDDVRPLDGEQAGLYAVRLPDGEQLVTHGPDLHLADGELPPPGEERRAPICAETNAQHVLYGRPVGAPDRTAEVEGQIRDEIARMNAVLNRDSLASGGPMADYRVRCDVAGEVRVDSFVNPGDASFSNVVAAARAAGFSRGDLNYTVFYDGSNGCGIGSIYNDDRLAADNWNNRGGGYGIAYAGCWQGVPMHENAHNMGAVQYGAPNSTGSGAHCNDEWDVMCYSDGGDYNQTMRSVCEVAERFDCGNDDYFDSAPEPGEYLSSHWNIGSRLNRFLTFARELAPPGSFEAERAELSGGAGVASEHAGYSGEGYVEWGQDQGEARFAVASAGASPATLDLHYANGSGAPSAVAVLVNGAEVAQAQLPPLPSWNVWGSVAVPIGLTAGSNTIAVAQVGGAGELALDYLTLRRGDPDPATMVLVPGDPDPATKVLVPGVPVKGRTGRAPSVRLYKVEVPAGQSSLEVSLDAPGKGVGNLRDRKRARSAAHGKARKAKRAPIADLDLRLRPGATPSAGDSVCRPLRGSSDETCAIANPTPGWWYVAVELRRGSPKRPFRLSAGLN